MFTEMYEGQMQALGDSLNQTIFSTDSIYGILFILFIIVSVVMLSKSLWKLIGTWVGVILLLEIMHLLAFQTELGVMFPQLTVIFKYQVIVMLAQLCVGTPVSEWLLMVQAFLDSTIGVAGSIVIQAIQFLWMKITDVYEIFT